MGEKFLERVTGEPPAATRISLGVLEEPGRFNKVEKQKSKKAKHSPHQGTPGPELGPHQSRFAVFDLKLSNLRDCLSLP